MTDPIVTDLGDESPDRPEEDFSEFDAPITTPLFDESGDSIDDSRLRQRVEDVPPPRDAKPGIPTLDEWMDFWSRIVLRVACDWYIEWAFRGVDENSLTDREIGRIQMTDAERQRVAVPIAELSHKSKLMRKHGRAIVASGGVFDAIVALGTWTSRVNRIAHKHKPKVMQGRVVNDGSGQAQPPAGAGFPPGANGGNVGPGWRIVNPGG